MAFSSVLAAVRKVESMTRAGHVALDAEVVFVVILEAKSRLEARCPPRLLALLRIAHADGLCVLGARGRHRHAQSAVACYRRSFGLAGEDWDEIVCTG